MTNSENKIEHIIFDNGVEFWKYSNTNLHQDKDLPAKIHSDGTEEYRKHGIPYRKLGPRTKHPSGEEWWQINWNIIGLNREDAAAIIWPDGIRTYIKTELPRRWETNKS